MKCRSWIQFNEEMYGYIFIALTWYETILSIRKQRYSSIKERRKKINIVLTFTFKHWQTHGRNEYLKSFTYNQVQTVVLCSNKYVIFSLRLWTNQEKNHYWTRDLGLWLNKKYIHVAIACLLETIACLTIVLSCPNYILKDHTLTSCLFYRWNCFWGWFEFVYLENKMHKTQIAWT